MKERGQRKMFSCQKHFSKVNPVQNDNNNNKIVVKKSKRASSSASNLSGNEEGAMTLEASLIVPIFLIVLLMLTSAGEILMIHQQISHGACEAAKRACLALKGLFAERPAVEAHIVEVCPFVIDDVKAVGTCFVPCKAHP
mgnify:CR=1 FL=1